MGAANEPDWLGAVSAAPPAPAVLPPDTVAALSLIEELAVELAIEEVELAIEEVEPAIDEVPLGFVDSDNSVVGNNDVADCIACVSVADIPSI